MHQFNVLVSLVLAWSATVGAVKIFNADPSRNWAVLVAGSNGFHNYRHQADVCHAYQILKKNGIPQENIITFMYDDIAHNTQNDFPGKIFNDYQHKDVYEGVVIDYKDDDVTPEMFTKVMRGDSALKAAGRKVLESGPEDNVFVFFSDHGAESLIAFPYDELYASSLNDTITYLWEKKRYNQMVFYIEACYSGSMFEEILSSHVKVYATTAANAHQSSYAAFCRDRDLYVCLADLYSYNWMVDTEKNDIEKRSLDDQYKAVKTSTRSSQVKKYGDMGLGMLKLAKFQSHNQFATGVAETDALPALDVASASDAHITALHRQIQRTNSVNKMLSVERKLQRVLQLGETVNQIFAEISALVREQPPSNHAALTKAQELNCFESVFKLFRTKCFSIQQVPEVAKHVSKIHQLCREGYKPDTMKEAILNVCG